MVEEKKEKWLNYLALSTVILAVCATLSTFKGGGYGSKALMNQTSASDQWAFFQAKSIKSSLIENEKTNLELQKSLLSSQSTIAEYQKKIDSYNSDIKRYKSEKDDIKKKAETYEKDRNGCQLHSSAFGIAVIFLQIAILLSSIAALIKKPLVWYLSLAVGAVGILYFFNGFFLFLKIIV